ncbi:MAG: aspartate dehydrogenase domain-containing protein [Rhodospirillales bacterium]|jgi:aspartate dehydrogenase
MRVALAGFGNSGQDVARRLTQGDLPGATLTAVTAKNLDKARENAAKLSPAPLVVPLSDLANHADIIAECATAEALPEILLLGLGAGKTVIVVSCAGLLKVPDVEKMARESSGRMRIANGALPGLDSLRCAREGTIHSVKLTSRIKPDSLAHEEYILEQGFDFANNPPKVGEPVKVFDGIARAAAEAFPRHFNVAVALSIAGIGFDRTEIEVWAESGIPGAIHHVEVESDDIGLSMYSRNRPSDTNPRTSRIVAPSIMAALRALIAPVVAGG